MKYTAVCSFLLSVACVYGQHFEQHFPGVAPEAAQRWPMEAIESVELTDAQHRLYTLQDGRVLSQSSKTPINYKDSSGNWRMIDAVPVQHTKGWRASDQPFPVHVGNDGSLVFESPSGQVHYGPALPAGSAGFSFHGPRTLRQPLSHGAYRDLEFRVNAIKSSVFLTNAPAGDWNWQRSVKLPLGASMRPAEFPEGALEVVSAKREVLSKILPLVVSDAQGDWTRLPYMVEMSGAGEVSLSATVPQAWLQAPERSYPVEIDPLITGPTSIWTGSFMPSCLIPNYNVDSIPVVIPAEISITSFLVTGSYYASPFSGAVMSDAEMYYSTSCGQTPGLTVGPPTGNLAGTGYNEDTEYRNPLTCCFTPSCSQQNFWLRMHLGRNFGPPGCNFTYVYHDPSSQWPFSAFVEGRTVESAAIQWQVQPQSQCGTECDVSIRSFVRYGVPPYQIDHPWAQAPTAVGNPGTNCNIPLVDETIAVVRPNCPQTCYEDPALSVPLPIITDQCGNNVTGLPPKTISIRETPDATATPSFLALCSGEQAQIQLNSCTPGTTVNWQGQNGETGSGSIDTTMTYEGNDTLIAAFTASASANNCQGPSTTIDIQVFPNPVADADIPETVIIQTDAVFTDSSDYKGGNASVVEWILPDGTVLTGNPATTQFTEPGKYEICLVIESSYSCRDTVCDTLEVIPPTVPLPNVVTPNGDGVNDALEFQYLEFFSPAQLTVFNRWGTVVFQDDNYQNDWVPEGLSEGTYFYELILFDGTAETSSLNIFRP